VVRSAPASWCSRDSDRTGTAGLLGSRAPGVVSSLTGYVAEFVSQARDVGDLQR
jgi:hypothetical protein